MNGKAIKETTQDPRSLYVVHVTAEMAPIAKVAVHIKTRDVDVVPFNSLSSIRIGLLSHYFSLHPQWCDHK